MKRAKYVQRVVTNGLTEKLVVGVSPSGVLATEGVKGVKSSFSFKIDSA